MAAQLHVRGGADGTTAHVEDLLGMAVLLKNGAASVWDVTVELISPRLRDSLTIGAELDFRGALALIDALAQLRHPLEDACSDLDRLGALVGRAALAYGTAEDGVLATMLHGLGNVLMGIGRIEAGDPAGGALQLSDGLPGFTDVLADTFTPVTALYAALVPDGRAEVTNLGVDNRAAARTAPHTMADLVADLALRNTGHHGEISVSFVTGADGRRRAIVDIPGTKSWDPVPNGDVTSVGTDIRAMAGRTTSYERGVLTALSAAGVTPDTDVMLVGHSEGGTIAVNAACAAARSGRFHITHIVTAGSPVGRVSRRLPATVQLLALENSADVVPDTDAAINPDRRNITTVTTRDQRYSISGNHDLATVYEREAAAADASADASLRAFVRSARGFLHATTMQTRAYWIRRDP